MSFVDVVYGLDYFSLYYFLFINTFYAVLILSSFVSLARRMKEVSLEKYSRLMQRESLPAISIIIPCYNESMVIIDSIYSHIKLTYPLKQIIIVNDGSTDSTIEKITQEFDLVEIPKLFPGTLSTAEVKAVYQSQKWPDLFVLDKVRGGKGDALNAGLNASITPLYLAADADTLIQKDALLRMIRPFLQNESIVAQGATIRLVNGSSFQYGALSSFDVPNTVVESVQVAEYLRSFLFGRLGWNQLGGNIIVSGAFGLFDREAVLRCGGYSANSIAEDIDLTLSLTSRLRHMHKKNTTHFLPDPIAWTVGPRNWKTLGRQRIRWHMALIETLLKFRYMIGNPKYGFTGMIALPYQLFGELIHPFIEVLSYLAIICGVYLGVIHTGFLVLFFSITWGITILLTLMAIAMESLTFSHIKGMRAFFGVIRAAFLEHFGYRQMYSLWKIRAFYEWFRKPLQWTLDR